MDDKEGARLGRNVRYLREARGLTQSQIAKVAGLPRATWSHLETGAANPTLAVLSRVARALQVSLEELVARERADTRRYPAGSLPVKQRGLVRVHKLLPDPLPSTEIDRLEIPKGGRMVGVPHTPGTREYLTCESGAVRLVASGETFDLAAGDVVAFRGDQRHSYENVGPRTAVCYSVVVVARV
jgi:transcriptional regulator with XRE-family HTH domain